MDACLRAAQQKNMYTIESRFVRLYTRAHAGETKRQLKTINCSSLHYHQVGVAAIQYIAI